MLDLAVAPNIRVHVECSPNNCEIFLYILIFPFLAETASPKCLFFQFVMLDAHSVLARCSVFFPCSMLGFCVKSSARARSVLGVDAREYSVSI